MAVLMMMEVDGMTTDDYDRLNDALGIHGDEDAPDGLIQHAAGVDNGRLVVVDLWESEAKLGAFFESRLGPAIEQLELPQVDPRIIPTHNYTRGLSDDAAVMVLIDMPEAGTAQYDQMLATMPAHVNDAHPAHIHIAASDGNGLYVADIWGSEEAFGQFAQEQIGPAAEQAGITGVTPRMVKVHNTLRGKAGVGS